MDTTSVSCPVCLEEGGDIVDGELIKLPCSHYICTGCKYNVIGGICPMCRAPMPELPDPDHPSQRELICRLFCVLCVIGFCASIPFLWKYLP